MVQDKSLNVQTTREEWLQDISNTRRVELDVAFTAAGIGENEAQGRDECRCRMGAPCRLHVHVLVLTIDIRYK